MANPGDQFGPYVLEELLGRGAYGEVWKASRKGALLRVPVAMKLLTGAVTERDAFLQEAELWLKAAASPYVVPVHDVGEDRGLFYFVSQFIDGGTLRKRIGFRTGNGLPVEEVVELVRGVLLGLEYLHAADVVHLDLKPDNVLLQQGVPRLADFGLARVLLESYVRQADPLGTVRYQPPEAFNDQISRQWDVWSMGVMLYELLTGNPPFDAKTRNALVEQIKAGQRTATPRFIPAPLREVIEGALQVDRKTRYPEPAAMRTALEAALQRVRTPPVRGADVPTDLLVTVREAEQGCRKQLQWGNRRVGVSVPKGAQANDVVTVPGEGMPGQAGGGPGDLLVRLVVLPEVRGPRPLDERTNPVDGATMLYIPGGEFLMGSDPAEIEAIWKRFRWPEEWKQYTKDESPRHRVEVSGFWLYRDLVTVRQYREFCAKTKRTMPDGPVWAPTWEGQDEHPVVNVSWEDATAYAAWAGGRLPTEAEWEYAARGGNTGLAGKPRHVFVWGDDLPGRGSQKVANLSDMSLKQQQHFDVKNWALFDGYEDGFPFTSPVGSFPANGFGLPDMAGNVWEWCVDYYAEDYYRTCAAEGPCRNPFNKSINNLCVARGGSWNYIPDGARVAYRYGDRPQNRRHGLGFRGGGRRSRTAEYRRWKLDSSRRRRTSAESLILRICCEFRNKGACAPKGRRHGAGDQRIIRHPADVRPAGLATAAAGKPSAPAPVHPGVFFGGNRVTLFSETRVNTEWRASGVRFLPPPSESRTPHVESGNPDCRSDPAPVPASVRAGRPDRWAKSTGNHKGDRGIPGRFAVLKPADLRPRRVQQLDPEVVPRRVLCRQMRTQIILVATAAVTPLLQAAALR